MSAGFVHLRVHTAYSLSEGAIRIKQLAQLCRQFRMPAVALTDTNNLFGGMEFSVTLAQAGIQPIVGCQLRIAPAGARRHRALPEVAARAGAGRVRPPGAERRRLRQPAEAAGRRPRAGGERRSAGGVPGRAGRAQHRPDRCLTGGADGPLGRLLQDGREADAEAMLDALEGAFAGRLYVELQRHGSEGEAITEPSFLALADRRGLPIVATNEACFATPDMFEAHDALLCIAQGAHIADRERRRLTPEHFFKSGEEMREIFADLPDAVANTALIARRCAFMIEPRKPILPPFASAGGSSEADALRAEARAGLEHRLAARAARGAGGEQPARLAPRPGLPRAARLRARRDLRDGLRRLFPDRLRVHPLGQGARDPGGSRPRLRRRLGRGLGADHHRPRPAALRPACSSASSTRSGCRCRTSTSTSARTAATR